MPADETMHPEVQRVGRAVGEHLAEIAELFKPGVKLTFLARSPNAPDGSQDMVITDDGLTDAIAALTVRRNADA